MISGFNLEELLAGAVFTGRTGFGIDGVLSVAGKRRGPMPVKAGLTLLLTVLLHPLHGPAGLALGPWQWAQVAWREVMIGVVLGLVGESSF